MEYVFNELSNVTPGQSMLRLDMSRQSNYVTPVNYTSRRYVTPVNLIRGELVSILNYLILPNKTQIPFKNYYKQ